MINLFLEITNPWARKNFKNLFNWHRMISKNMSTELYMDSDNILFNFKVCLSFWKDHAGLELGLGLLGYNISMNFYDIRHWDGEHKCWEIYGD